MSETIKIEDVKINEAKFKLLSNELVMNSVVHESSPFNVMRKALREELKAAEGLDDIQKVGVFTEFLKDAYATASKQASATALDIMKTNETLKLEAIKLELEYTVQMQKAENMREEKAGITKANLLKDKEIAIANYKIAGQKYANLETRAKLKKQFGVEEATTYKLGTASGDYKMYDFKWYKVNREGNWVDASGNEVPEPTVEAIINGEVDVTSQLVNTRDPGAIDKQLEGYDKLNQKDLIKTLNELQAMLTNAQADTPAWIPATVRALIKEVAKSQNVHDALDTPDVEPEEKL